MKRRLSYVYYLTQYMSKTAVSYTRAHTHQKQEIMQLPLKKPQRYRPSFAWSVSFPFWLKSLSRPEAALSNRISSEVFSPLMARQRQLVRFSLAAGGSRLHRGDGRYSNLKKVTDSTAAEIIYQESEKKLHQCNEQGV